MISVFWNLHVPGTLLNLGATRPGAGPSLAPLHNLATTLGFSVAKLIPAGGEGVSSGVGAARFLAGVAAVLFVWAGVVICFGAVEGDDGLGSDGQKGCTTVFVLGGSWASSY